MEVVAVISAPGGQGHSHGRCGAAELQKLWPKEAASRR